MACNCAHQNVSIHLVVILFGQASLAKQKPWGARMSTYFSQDIATDIVGNSDDAELSMSLADRKWPILRMWDGGFAVSKENLPPLRGFVDIYDGNEHAFHCLIVASEIVGQEVHCGFKRMTPFRTKAPLDFVTQDAPQPEQRAI